MTSPAEHSRSARRRRARVPLRRRAGFWFSLFATLVILGAIGEALYLTYTTPGGLLVALKVVPSPKPTPTAKKTLAPVLPIDLNLNSIDDPTSFWVVIDKLRAIQPESFVPKDLIVVPVVRKYDTMMRKPAAEALKQMFDAYKAQTGRGLKALSGYRSYAAQKAAFDGDYTLSALPGHSEHQSGMAIDIGATSGKCPVYDCFAYEPESQWMEANAWQYGFIQRYPKGKENITGYQYEPWHYRFVGVPLATRMHNAGVQSLEEEFGLPAAAKYAFQEQPPTVVPFLPYGATHTIEAPTTR